MRYLSASLSGLFLGAAAIAAMAAQPAGPDHIAAPSASTRCPQESAGTPHPHPRAHAHPAAHATTAERAARAARRRTTPVPRKAEQNSPCG
ncbi:MAG TPA: hypothetical protein VGN70_05710 [Gammaproteobacteria bacterium]